MVKQKKWICYSGLISFVGNNFGIPVDRTRDVSQRGALHNVRIWSVLFHIHFSSKLSFSQKNLRNCIMKISNPLNIIIALIPQ